MNFSMIRYVIGLVMLFESAFLSLPCLIALIYHEKKGFSFWIMLFVCLIIGILFVMKKPKKTVYYAKEGFLTVAISWIVMSFFGALPFVINGDIPSAGLAFCVRYVDLDILLVTGGMLLFGACFCFFAKDILPTYYDANKINYVSQGIFRIHLVGLSFNNGNWIYICTTLKIWILATVVLYPLAGIIIINCFNIALWDISNKIFLIMILGGMVISIYIIGKKYE